jgi:hypothetical protein
MYTYRQLFLAKVSSLRRYPLVLVGLLGVCWAVAWTQEHTLVGVTWDSSELISFDPYGGSLLEKHLQLNSGEAFRGLAFDEARRRLYALSQGTNNLYYVDVDTMEITHVGNLRIDTRGSAGYFDVGPLAYDPFTDTLYATIEYWNLGYSRTWSELCQVNPQDATLRIIGRVDGPFIDSLGFNKADRQLYGLAIYGSGSWDSPFAADFVRIDTATAQLQTLFHTPYHTMMGLAVYEPFTFFSWINWTSHVYGETDLRSGVVRLLGNSDSTNAISAMVYRDFTLGTRPSVVAPASFVFGGRVDWVWDPDSLLEGRIKKGHRFAGRMSYDTAGPYKDPDPNVFSPYGMSVRLNGIEFSGTGLWTRIVNNYYEGWNHTLSDSLSFEAIDRGRATLSWLLTDPSAQVLRSNETLPDSYDLSKWQNSFVITGYRGSDRWNVSYYVMGSIDRITRTQAQPEFDGDQCESLLLMERNMVATGARFTPIQPDFPPGMQRRRDIPALSGRCLSKERRSPEARETRPRHPDSP